MQLKNKKFILIGFIAGFALLILYFLILSLANSFGHAREQFSQMWYWILLLLVGFGIQVGLYSFIREKFKTVPGRVLATSGGISTGSMIACCLHHLVDVLPIMGLAALSLFLIKYQVLFLVVGILSNLIGIAIMLEIIQKNNLDGGFLKRILVYDMSIVKKLVIVLSLVLVVITFFWTNKSKATNTQPITASENQSKSQALKNLPTKTDNQGGVSFEITPLSFSFENPIKFEIKINTHSVSLDFDLVETSILEDNFGDKYQPLKWDGSSPGGHHRSGILVFPPLDSKAKKVKLTIQDTYLRIFEWELE